MLGTPLLTIFQNAYVFVDSVTITALSFSTLIGFHLKQNDKKATFKTGRNLSLGLNLHLGGKQFVIQLGAKKHWSETKQRKIQTVTDSNRVMKLSLTCLRLSVDRGIVSHVIV